MSKKLITKKVPFQGKQLTMYSIDGITWSTRSEELQAILDRHSREQAGYGADLKGEEKDKTPVVKPKPKKFNRVHDDGEIDEAIEEDNVEEEVDELDTENADEDIDLLDEDDRPKNKKGAPAAKTKPVTKIPATKEVPLAKKSTGKEKAPAKNVAPKKPVAKPKAKAAPAKAKKKK